jgi:hypothetical protein
MCTHKQKIPITDFLILLNVFRFFSSFRAFISLISKNLYQKPSRLQNDIAFSRVKFGWAIDLILFTLSKTLLLSNGSLVILSV